MPKLRGKRSEKQLEQLSKARQNRASVVICAYDVEPVSDDDIDCEQELDFAGEDVSSSLDLANRNDLYYYDSGNEEVDETLEAPRHYVPHALVYRRKHTMVIALVGDVATLVPYDGDNTELFQIVGVPYVKQHSQEQITVGFTSFINIKHWATEANSNARSGIRHPRFVRTAGCRSVRDSILATDGMAANCVFPFFYMSEREFWQI